MKITDTSVIKLSTFLALALLLMTKNGSVLIITLLMLYSVRHLYINKNQSRLNRFDFIVVATLATYFLVNIPVAISDHSTLRYFQGGIRLILCIPIYFFIYATIINPKSIQDKLSQGVIIGSVGAFFVAIYQFFLLGMPRVDGFLYSINFGYLSCALAFLSLCLSTERDKYFLPLIFASILNTISMFLTFTRGAILAAPLLLMLFIILKWRDFGGKRITSILSICLTLIFTLYATIPEVKERINYTISEFSDIKNGNYNSAISSGTRLYLWKAAIEAYKLSPWIGLPYHDREVLNKHLYQQGEINIYALDTTRGHAHNQYFEMLASNGFCGLLGITLMLFIPFIVFLKHYISTKSIWGFTGTIFVAGFIIYGLTEVPLEANLISTFYGFMLATIFAMIRIEKYN
ncbi:O-antigen ligase family protein [Plesiomonas shigelloides]|uniref:O-antigen ligase family protein n=1 Tax=Plesiomonas shigelloides TaxID=703 RepID=UPI00057AF8F5|nr:O-antigen ligase family protein [Plesiomonas shigelloides]